MTIVSKRKLVEAVWRGEADSVRLLPCFLCKRAACVRKGEGVVVLTARAWGLGRARFGKEGQTEQYQLRGQHPT